MTLPPAPRRWRQLVRESEVSPARLLAYLPPAGLALFGGPLLSDGLGSRTILGIEPFLRLSAHGRRLRLASSSGGAQRFAADPLRALEELTQHYRSASPARPETGAGPVAIGALGFGLSRLITGQAEPPGRPLMPDLDFGFYASTIEYESGVYVVSDGSGGRAMAAFDRALASAEAEAGPRARRGAPRGEPGPIARASSRAAYLASVRKVKRHIAAGDVYQVNLSQRFSGELRESPAASFERLWQRFPAPLMAFLTVGRGLVLSDSPELFLELAGDAVETRPIKGTRRRGATPTEDRALARELSAAGKDGAELAMIVDLERNDLGRVAETGSVTVPSLKRLVTLPTVHHLVATVQARLRSDVGLAQLLRATFPGGSITGAPKESAVAIIGRLEPVRREVYTGAIGRIALAGPRSATFNVAIRTLLVRGDRWYLHAGGGIVAESDPVSEHEETLVKAEALLSVLRA